MKHTRNITIAVLTLLITASLSFATEVLVVVKSTKIVKTTKIQGRSLTWTVDNLPPDTYTISFTDEKGNDISPTVNASVFIKGQAGNSHSPAFDIAAFGFNPIEVSSARTASGASFNTSSKTTNLIISISSFSVSNVLKTKHDISKNAIGNIR